MAVINGKGGFPERGVYQAIWTPLGNADTGTPETLSGYPKHRVQFSGAFGGATAVLEGSNDGTTYVTLVGVNSAGATVAVSTTSAAQFDLEVVPRFIRPRTSGGAGSAVTVTLNSKSLA